MTKKRIEVNLSVDLQSIFNEYIEEKKALNVSPATITTYSNSFKDYYKNIGDSLTNKDVFTFINILQKRGCKSTTVNHSLRHLRAFANWGIRKEYLEPISIKLLKSEESVKDTFKQWELKKLLRRPNKNDSFVIWRTWAVINWLLATGNRFGTIQKIQIQDLNLKDSEIYIHHTKNKKIQILPMSNALVNAMRTYLKMWRSDAKQTEPLFCDIYGDWISHTALFHSIKKYCLNRNIDKHGIHIFRHTFAKQFILNGGGVFQLQKILGHSTLDMTRKYVNLYADDLKADMQNCNPLDNLNKNHKIKRKL